MDDFIDYLTEIFSEFGDINSRKMFGGYGIYHDGLMFALVADKMLYFKADDKSSDRFVEKGLGQFQFEKNGKLMKMSYFQAPEEIFEDAGLAKKWADLAFDAALRNRK